MLEKDKAAPTVVPLREAQIEMRVVNSRFIATASPARSVDEAKSFVAHVKAEFADASHNVSAYLVGHANSVVAHCHDDGEPSGTAGPPALAVLRGSGLGDVAVVVTRYFGGTKLGTGGLVRAYGDAVRAVLEVLPRGVKLATHTAAVAAPYSFLERLRLLVASQRGVILDEDFAADVTLTARFAVDDFPAFEAGVREMSGGRIEVAIVETDEASIVPLDTHTGGDVQPR